ncbi:protein deltex [Plodia interpunctella]|uniref:protein deltex n=1 Tax=Plodia interpunctella TaxID=58824 RepID=UPI002368B4A5|nr:protein deltex [Plodia interpunctella]XP_053609627.1 protein deltex [Plodia interpunctella]XP_053609628.1 protein deltex [Plodia interpunctella]
MSSVHCVVVWEWQSGGQWLPHTPGVARTLERAHAKKLTRVVLADADPALKGHYVNLRTLTQYSDTCDGGTAQTLVRRSCYSVQSPGGRGVRWEWTTLEHAQLEPLSMEVQCHLEEAWSRGAKSVSFLGWAGCLLRMTAHCGGVLRLLRRRVQPPYPLVRSEDNDSRRPRIPQQHTGSSVHSVQSIQSLQSVQSLHSSKSLQNQHCTSSNIRACGARSASPRERSASPHRKTGFARQILHNLNIFSHNSKGHPCQAEAKHRALESETSEEPRTDTESGSTRSGRRHSVDTVSTYLSHESKESLQQAVVGELLNCSGGSDDVFHPPGAPAPPCPRAPAGAPSGAPAGAPAQDLPLPAPGSDGTIVGLEPAAAALSAWVRLEPHPQWGALCPACRAPLQPAQACVALTGCQHMLHLHCLNRQLQRFSPEEEMYISCLMCGREYGRTSSVRGAETGPQPRGTMAWTLQPLQLPAAPHAVSILVTYSFRSGRQSRHHPQPGAPYYAVGFPRRTVLPDTALGRCVLQALTVAWQRGKLFAVSASRTTGREHVVSWTVAPPPACRDHYLPPADGDALLRGCLARLHRLLHADHTL